MGVAQPVHCGRCDIGRGESVEDLNLDVLKVEPADESQWRNLEAAKAAFGRKVITCKDGNAVTIRPATEEDKKDLHAIADQEGVGAGMSGDVLLFYFFDHFVVSPEMFSFWVEDESGAALGLLVVTFSSRWESFWHTLRIGKQARCKGLAGLLFKEAAKLCVDVQGPHSISRWGVVSTNEIMTQWSSRMSLDGPMPMRRFISEPVEAAEKSKALPAEWTMRAASEEDKDLVFAHIGGKHDRFQVAPTKYGTMNIWEVGGAGMYTEHRFARSVEKEITELDGLPQQGMAPLVFDESGSLAGFATYMAQKAAHDPEKGILFFGYIDGTPRGIQVVLEILRHEAAALGCQIIMGYIPAIDWLLEDFEASNYKRAAKTEEFFYQWQNSDYLPPDAEATGAAKAGPEAAEEKA